MSFARAVATGRLVARSSRFYSTPVAPAATRETAATPSEWASKRDATRAHAAHTAGMWKKVFYFVCLPGLALATYRTKQIEDEHHAHMEHVKHEHGDEPAPEYAYMNKRQKPFPWGMNSLFFNPEVNKDMSQTDA